jgi:hypothetical protein
MARIEIRDEDELYRRIQGRHVYPDGEIRSNAFKRSQRPDRQPSVDIARLTTEDECLARAPGSGWGIAVLTAADVRSIPPLDVVHDPIDADPNSGRPANPSHAYIDWLPDDEHGMEFCDRLGQRSKLHRRPERR